MSSNGADKNNSIPDTLFRVSIPEGTGFDFMNLFEFKIPGGIDAKLKFPSWNTPPTGIPAFDPASIMEMYKSPEMTKFLDMLKKAGIKLEIKK